jgi:hypothetical protein
MAQSQDVVSLRLPSEAPTPPIPETAEPRRGRSWRHAPAPFALATREES